MLNHSNLVYELREEIAKLKRFEKEAKDSRENEARALTEVQRLRDALKRAQGAIEDLEAQHTVMLDERLIFEVFEFVSKAGWFARKALAANAGTPICNWDGSDIDVLHDILHELASAGNRVDTAMQGFGDDRLERMANEWV